MSDNRASEWTPSPATPAPSLRDLAERVLTTGESLRALRAARIGGTTKEFHTADMQARQTFNQAFDAFSEAATPAAIIALSDEVESTRSALREAQEDTRLLEGQERVEWLRLQINGALGHLSRFEYTETRVRLLRALEDTRRWRSPRVGAP